jgi:hypothetical protein
LLLVAFAGLISLVYLYLSGPRYGRLIGIDNAKRAEDICWFT